MLGTAARGRWVRSHPLGVPHEEREFFLGRVLNQDIAEPVFYHAIPVWSGLQAFEWPVAIPCGVSFCFFGGRRGCDRSEWRALDSIGPFMAERRGEEMRSGFAWIVAAVGAVLIAGATNSSAADFKYVGVNKCKTCHKKELIGDQYGKWKDAKHSKAFEALKSDKAAEIAKKQGITGPAYQSEKCLKCHVTAYGKPASAFEREPLKETDGVQCESCHGPGSGYKKKKTMEDHDKALAAGLWEPGKDEKICTTCHNDQSPTWDPAKGFDYEQHKKDIAHPIPKDVKGHYAEMEKKMRKERMEEEE